MIRSSSVGPSNRTAPATNDEISPDDSITRIGAQDAALVRTRTLPLGKKSAGPWESLRRGVGIRSATPMSDSEESEILATSAKFFESQDTFTALTKLTANPINPADLDGVLQVVAGLQELLKLDSSESGEIELIFNKAKTLLAAKIVDFPLAGGGSFGLTLNELVRKTSFEDRDLLARGAPKMSQGAIHQTTPGVVPDAPMLLDIGFEKASPGITASQLEPIIYEIADIKYLLKSCIRQRAIEFDSTDDGASVPSSDLHRSYIQTPSDNRPSSIQEPIVPKTKKPLFSRVKSFFVGKESYGHQGFGKKALGLVAIDKPDLKASIRPGYLQDTGTTIGDRGGPSMLKEARRKGGVKGYLNEVYRQSKIRLDKGFNRQGRSENDYVGAMQNQQPVIIRKHGYTADYLIKAAEMGLPPIVKGMERELSEESVVIAREGAERRVDELILDIPPQEPEWPVETSFGSNSVLVTPTLFGLPEIQKESGGLVSEAHRELDSRLHSPLISADETSFEQEVMAEVERQAKDTRGSDERTVLEPDEPEEIDEDLRNLVKKSLETLDEINDHG